MKKNKKEQKGTKRNKNESGKCFRWNKLWSCCA